MPDERGKVVEMAHGNQRVKVQASEVARYENRGYSRAPKTPDSASAGENESASPPPKRTPKP